MTRRGKQAIREADARKHEFLEVPIKAKCGVAAPHLNKLPRKGERGRKVARHPLFLYSFAGVAAYSILE